MPAPRRLTPRHYHWAGLDFMLDADGTPVLIEANRSSHMLGEYLEFFGNERPFELVANVMNRAGGPPCLLWRRGEMLRADDESAAFIGHYLAKHLREPPVICDVEDNQEPRDELLARDGKRVRPGCIFRWWYGLPWSFERAGVTVINPNCVWVTVRDKLACYEILAGQTPGEAESPTARTPPPPLVGGGPGWGGQVSTDSTETCHDHRTPSRVRGGVPDVQHARTPTPGPSPIEGEGSRFRERPNVSPPAHATDNVPGRPRHFRVPRSFAAADADSVRRFLAEHADLFAHGFIVKPRVGWGGQGVQIGEPGDEPRAIGVDDMLSERILPPRDDGRFWEARVFVMAGVYLGGIRHSSPTPHTNYWQGGRPERLDDATAARLEPAALEAVSLLDAAADRLHHLPAPPEGRLTQVVY